MILPAQTIAKSRFIHPLLHQSRFNGATYGLGPAGYDVRLAQTVKLWPGRFVLASTIEHFNIPADLLGVVHDKSTWARQGIAVQNTVIEPGWRGFLTIEITMHAWRFIRLPINTPIAQIVFHRLEEQTDKPYDGRYQDQEEGPQEARLAA